MYAGCIGAADWKSRRCYIFILVRLSRVRSPLLSDSRVRYLVRERLHQHYDFLASPHYASLKTKFESTTEGEPTVRHAFLVEYTPNCESLGRGAPFTGTAIYVDTDRAWDFAWQLWATIVPRVKGCMGVAGGYIVEPIDGHERCFIAWVGWNTIEEHHAYHHTKHWQDRRAILEQGHKGYREYYHVVFNNSPLPLKSLI